MVSYPQFLEAFLGPGRQLNGLLIEFGQLDVGIKHVCSKIEVLVQTKKALFSKKEKEPFDLHPILPRLRFKGKRKEKLTG
jgi:hypothetical protein